MESPSPSPSPLRVRSGSHRFCVRPLYVFCLFLFSAAWGPFELMCIDVVSQLNAKEIEYLGVQGVRIHRKVKSYRRESIGNYLDHIVGLAEAKEVDVDDVVEKQQRKQKEKEDDQTERTPKESSIARRVSERLGSKKKKKDSFEIGCERIRRWCAENDIERHGGEAIGNSPWTRTGQDDDDEDASGRAKRERHEEWFASTYPSIDRGLSRRRDVETSSSSSSSRIASVASTLTYRKCIQSVRRVDKAKDALLRTCRKRRVEICRFVRVATSRWGRCDGVRLERSPRRNDDDVDRTLAETLAITSTLLDDERHDDTLRDLFNRLVVLATDVGTSRAERRRADAMTELTRIRDPLHDDVWPRICEVRENQYQMCPRRVWYVRQHAEVAWWCVYLILCGMYAAMFKMELVVTVQLLTTIVLARAVRVVSFMTTTLPPPNPECRLTYTAAGDGGGCGDLMFSGHATIVTTAVWYVWTQDLPFRVPRALCVMLTLVGLHELFASAVEKWHYTADMVVGVVVTSLMFHVVGDWTGYHVRASYRDARVGRTSFEAPSYFTLDYPLVAVSTLVVFVYVGYTSYDANDVGFGVLYATAAWFVSWSLMSVARHYVVLPTLATRRRQEAAEHKTTEAARRAKEKIGWNNANAFGGSMETRRGWLGVR